MPILTLVPQPPGLMHRHMRQVQDFSTSSRQDDKKNTLCYRHTNLSMHRMGAAPILSIKPWILRAQVLVREDIRTLRLTATSLVRTWTTTLLPTNREHSLS